MNQKYNFDGYTYLDKNKIRDEIKTNLYTSGVLNTYSYHINPLKFLLGLAAQLKALNVKVFENTPITKIINDKNGIKLFSESKMIPPPVA